MGHQDAPVEAHSFLLAHGDKPLPLSALEWSDERRSPDTKCWLTDTSDFSQRASSKSPSLYSAPSTCSTQDFPPTPPRNSSLRLPQVPAIPTIRHRTPQACDKCRERKTKCSGHRPTCLRCSSRGLSCKYSARETRIRGSLKSRTLVQTFGDRPLFIEPVQRKTNLWDFPTPAHHSRKGYCRTSAFTRFPDGDNAHKAPAIPVYTTTPAAGRYSEEFHWNQPEDLVSPSIPVSFRFSTWPQTSLDSTSNPVDKTRKPLQTSLSLLDTGRLDDHSYDQVPSTDSVPIRDFDFNYSRLTSRADSGSHLPLSKDALQGSIFAADQPQPPMPENQSALDFNEDPFSLVEMEGFSATSFSNFYHVFDTPFLNGLGIFC